MANADFYVRVQYDPETTERPDPVDLVYVLKQNTRLEGYEIVEGDFEVLADVLGEVSLIIREAAVTL